MLSRYPLNDSSDLMCFFARLFVSVFRDRKRKNFVGEDGNTKKIRTESGVRIPATYKKNMYPLQTSHMLIIFLKYRFSSYQSSYFSLNHSASFSEGLSFSLFSFCESLSYMCLLQPLRVSFFLELQSRYPSLNTDLTLEQILRKKINACFGSN